MTVCTQPGCTGTIVDGYCDICGSPPGAAPYNGLKACTQPGCTGTIVDGYCDVCGSPADAVPFVPAAASAASHAPADEPEILTRRIPRVQIPSQRAEGDPDEAQDYRTRVEEAQLPNDVREAALREVGKLEQTNDQSPESGDISTWLDTILDLPWGTKTTDWIDIQGSREVEATLRRLIEPAVAEQEADAAEVEAPVADLEEADAAEVEAAVAEQEEAVADLEEGEAAEVEAAVADLEEADTAEIEAAVAEQEKAVAEQEEPAADLEEVDAAEAEAAVAEQEKDDDAEVEPATDLEEGDTAEIEPVAADLEADDTAAVGQGHDDAAAAGSRHDDTVVRPGVAAVHSGDVLVRPQPPEQQVHGPEPVRTPAKKRRLGLLALAAMAVAAVLIGALFAASRDGGVTAQSLPTVTPTGTATDTGGEEPTILLVDLPDYAGPFEAVRIQGTYRRGPDTFLDVQRQEGGEWLAFPVPTKTDKSGRFTAYVELGPPGRYRLRVVDPDSGVTSKTFVVVIRG